MRYLFLISFTFLTGLHLSGCASLQGHPDKKSPAEMAQLYVELGTQAYLRGDFARAVEDLRNALTHDSKNAIAHNHLGLAYYGLDRKQLALEEVKKAVSLNPLYSDALINLGLFAADERDFSKARGYFNKALENLEYRYRHRALTNLAQVAIQESKISEAKNYLYKSLQANPDFCTTHFLLGTVQMRENQPQLALESFKRSIASTCAANIEGHYQLGLAYIKNRDYSKARKQFVFLLQEYPQSKQAKSAGEQLKYIP